MKCLITGGNGFIGSCLIEKLFSENHTVRCLVRKTSNYQHLSSYPIEYCYGSLFDFDSLCAAVNGVDYIFHLAGQTRALKNSDYFQTNSVGAKNIFLAAKKASPNIKRIVHFSSLAAIGPSLSDQPLTEDVSPHPITPYGQSKLESEKTAREFMDTLPITIIRPPVVFGERDKSGFALFKSAVKGFNLSIGKYDPLLVPIYVKDLVDGCYTLSQRQEAVNEAFFVCGDEITSPSAMFKILSEFTNSTPKNVSIPPFLAKLAVSLLELRAQIIRKPNRLNSAKLVEVRYSWLASNAKAKALGLKACTPLRESMKETLSWYKEAGWL